jgi:hypothetical protein
MKPRFPLIDLSMREVKIQYKITKPLYKDSRWQLNQNGFAMQLEVVGNFFAMHGSEVEYSSFEDVNKASLELYLNGSVYGAILHQ